MMKNQSYRYSHTSENFGAYYDKELYLRDTYDNRVWSIEKRVLSDYFGSQNNINNKNLLDFACGTGRIAEFLMGFNFHDIVGIDISDPMLAIAKKRLQNCILVKSDITDEVELAKLEKFSGYFDYVTAFRFFLNAEEELRESAIKSLQKLCKNNAILIVNIHISAKSIMYLYCVIYNLITKVLKHFGIRKYKKCMSLHINDLKALFRSYGFEMFDVQYYSFLPPVLAKIIPIKIWTWIELRLFKKNIEYSNYYMCFFQKVNDNPEKMSA